MRTTKWSSHPYYTVWENMRQRCANPSRKNFKDYGGRGIKVCERWNDFNSFVMDMGPKPTDKHCLERKDNDAGYSPENCIWATRKEQIRNQRVRFDAIFVDGVRLSEWCKLNGVKYGTAHARILSERKRAA